MKCQICHLWEKKGKRHKCTGCNKKVCRHCWNKDQRKCVDCATKEDPEPDGVYWAMRLEGFDI